MNHEDIKARGRALGLNGFLLEGSGTALIHAIQRAEGHSACFRGERRLTCDETGCEWRRECQKLIAAWRR